MKHSWISVVCCTLLTKTYHCQAANLTFPENFLIGAATASYQIEGAWNASDKGEHIWDWYTHYKPELIADGSNADIACDSYNKWEEDVEWIKTLGLDYYRFSLSWPRILPNGFADKVSEDGIAYYKNLIEALVAYNITPMVTLYHWDHPRILEDLGGWTNDLMVTWFTDYARVVFEELGPLVKYFVTLNEPRIFCEQGYNSTRKAPGKVLENMGHYICLTNALKAHATVYHMYDDEFRSAQEGQIGIVPHCNGWVHAIYVGDYPEIVKTRIANISALEGWPFSRLPELSEEWIAYIRGTADFFGLNHYTSSMPVFDPEEELGIYTIDSGIIAVVNGTWSTALSSWLFVVPDGLGSLLRMIRDQYDNPPVYIFENGYSDAGELEDYGRISFFHSYLSAALSAINDDGCNVVAYTIWSLLDNFEWEAGYTELFGIISVDFTSGNRTRTAKLSTTWWQEVLRTRELQPVPTANRLARFHYPEEV